MIVLEAFELQTAENWTTAAVYNAYNRQHSPIADRVLVPGESRRAGLLEVSEVFLGRSGGRLFQGVQTVLVFTLGSPDKATLDYCPQPAENRDKID
jgi:hypothetical protein